MKLVHGMMLMLVGAMLLLPMNTMAQTRTGGLSPAEKRCYTIRRAHRTEMRYASLAARDSAVEQCYAAKRSCLTDVALEYPNGCIGTGRKDCDAATLACDRTRRDCRTGQALRPIRRRYVAARFDAGCKSFLQAGCPFKTIGRRNEAKLCAAAERIVNEPLEDELSALLLE